MLGFVGIDHRDRHVVGQTQPRTHFKRSLGAHVVLLVAVVAHLVDAVHIVETARNIVVGLVAATRNREVVLGRPVVVLVEERMPVGRVVIGPPELVVPRKRRRARQRRVLRTADQFLIDRLGIGNRRIDMVQERLRTVVITIVAILPPVDPRQTVGHHIGRHRAAVDRHRTVVIDDGRPFLGALGRNQHDARSAARTVDRGRGGIFQDVDALDVAGIDVNILRGRITIDNIQRIAAGRKRVHAPHTNLYAFARSSAGLTDFDAGNLTCKRLRHSGRRRREFAGLDAGHRTREVALAHRCIADDKHI